MAWFSVLRVLTWFYLAVMLLLRGYTLCVGMVMVLCIARGSHSDGIIMCGCVQCYCLADVIAAWLCGYCYNVDGCACCCDILLVSIGVMLFADMIVMMWLCCCMLVRVLIFAVA